MDDLLYIYFTVTIIAQAENNLHKLKAVKEMEKEMETESIVFESITGDVFMTLGNIKSKSKSESKEIKWSSILDMIASEEWYQTCEKWKFVSGYTNLKSDNVLKLDEELIKITCVKIIEPNIIFKSPDGELLVSIPFEICRSWYDNKVYLIGACFEAHKQLKREGKDGYGTDRPKVHPLIDTSISDGNEIPRPGGGTNPYVFHDKNDKEMDLYDVLEDLENENMTIIAIPQKVYCSNCIFDFQGPLRDGQQRNKVLSEVISLCSNCGFLHCLSCQYCFPTVGSTASSSSHHM
jgi:hypothetical protein